MEALAALAPTVAEVDIQVDVGRPSPPDPPPTPAQPIPRHAAAPAPPKTLARPDAAPTPAQACELGAASVRAATQELVRDTRAKQLPSGRSLVRHLRRILRRRN